MPIDPKIFNLLRDKTITFSASYLYRTSGSAQVQLRFAGGAGGNVDIALYSNVGSSMAVTKYVPGDWTSVYIVIQSNVAGSPAYIEVKELQLEIGDKATSYNKYNLGNK
jgi:hypothetical protein